MKKVILFIVLAMMLALWGLMQRETLEKKTAEAEPQTAPVSEAMSATDRRVLETAFESPESFEQAGAKSAAVAPVAQKKPRPQLLSEVERPARERVQKEPVAAESLYFWKDYESLRKDEVRNPDSKENREGVVALMQARQRRVKE